MKVKYEGTIGSYNFMMVDNSTIEVWSNFDNERPESFIFLKEGSVRDEKDFHYEIMAWVSKHNE
jgi:hypothetical protein